MFVYRLHSLLLSSSTRSTLATLVIAGRRQRIRNSLISPSVGRAEGIPKEVFTRKPQVLNSLSEDYCRISTEPGWHRNMASNTPMLPFSVKSSKMGAGTLFLFSSLSFCLCVVGFYLGGGLRKGGGQCSLFPSEIWMQRTSASKHSFESEM